MKRCLTIESNYHPHPVYREFHESGAKCRYLQGGLGAGKTTAAVWESIFQTRFPNNVILHLRKTFTAMNKSVIPTFDREFPAQLRKKPFHKTEHKQECVNGTVHYFGSMDSPAQRENYRSFEAGLIVLYEASEFEWEDFLLIFGRIGRVHGARGNIVMESNPPDSRHWLYSLFLEKEAGNPDYKMWKIPTEANRDHLPPGYIEGIQHQYRDSPNLLKRFLEGEFGSILGGTPVYQFSEARHCNRFLKFDPARPVFRGWDFGFHRPACVWAQMDGLDNFNVLRAVVGDRIHIDQWSDKIIQISNQFYPNAEFIDFCDIEGASVSANSLRTEFDVLRSKGLEPRAKRSSIKEGIQIIQNMLNTNNGDRPIFQVHPDSARILIESMSHGYVWEKRLGYLTENPLKGNGYDDIADALRYICVNLFGVAKPKWREQADSFVWQDWRTI